MTIPHVHATRNYDLLCPAASEEAPKKMKATRKHRRPPRFTLLDNWGNGELGVAVRGMCKLEEAWKIAEDIGDPCTGNEVGRLRAFILKQLGMAPTSYFGMNRSGCKRKVSGRQRSVTPEEKMQIHELHERKMSVKGIAQRLHIRQDAVRYAIDSARGET